MWENSTPCLTAYLMPGIGRRCHSVLYQVLWPKLGLKPHSIHGSRASRYQPFRGHTAPQTEDSCAQCERSVVTSTAPSNIARVASNCFSTGRNKKEVSKNTVSFWIRKVISLAYQLSGRPLPSPSPRARETRGIAPSLLFRKDYAVSQVLRAGTWKRHTTFTRHYLRDLSHKSLDTFYLGPVVAAQATV